MLDQLSQRITNNLLNHQVISEKEYTYYVYGSALLLSGLFNTLAAILIGVLAHQLLNVLIFLLFFMTLRPFTGGYHAKSYAMCSTEFCTLIVLLVWVISLNDQYSIFHPELLITSVVISDCIIFLLSPQDHKNVGLTQSERSKYRHVSRGLAVTESVLVLFFFSGNTHPYIGYAVAASLSMIVTAVLLSYGYFLSISERRVG